MASHGRGAVGAGQRAPGRSNAQRGQADVGRDAWAKQRDTPQNEAKWMYVDVLLTVSLLSLGRHGRNSRQALHQRLHKA